MKKYKITKFTEEEKQDIFERYGEWRKPENVAWVNIEYDKVVLSVVTLYGAKNAEKVEKKIDSYNWIKNIDEKVWTYEKFKDHLMHSSPYIESRIGDYKINDFNDETVQRILLEEIEGGGAEGNGFLSDFIENRTKEMLSESFQEELNIRQKLSDLESHTTPYVASRIRDYEFEDFDDEIFQRITLEECEKHTSPFIEKEIKKSRIETFKEELDLRITLEECEKYTSPFIEEEINRLKDKGEITTAEEELQQRINLGYYEDNVKDVEKISNKDEFWNSISVHGLENQSLLRDELNKVGKGFCLAKWNQVSILLQTGQTHSCHYPPPHKIPLKELENNISALHNTKFKKLQRKRMLEGEQPEECDYCWSGEGISNTETPRVMKSGEAWAFPHFNKIKNSNPSENILPTYVETSFSNQCNMSCGYCDVKSSSNWQQEIATKGHYPTSGMYNNTEWMERDGIVPIPFSQPNPYKDAFWKWWPELFSNLHTFRITGGEPLIQKDTFKVLDYIIENPKVNPEIVMSVNSNLSVPNDRWEEFIDKVKYITDNDLVSDFALFTSIESWGPHAEYVRDGLDSELLWSRTNEFLTKCEKPAVIIMATYNLTSIPSFDKVIKKVFELKKKHYNGKRYRHYAIILDTSYLQQPEFLSVRILPTKWIEKIKEDIGIMEKYAEEKYTYIYGHGHCGFYDFETEKLRRVLDWIESPLEDVRWLMKTRKDFVLFIDEFDKRRGKNFLETFPEMEDFYNLCKNTYSIL